MNTNINGSSKGIGATAPFAPKYQIVDIHSLDQEQFKASDRESTKLWGKVFVQNSVSEGIFDAIAAKDTANTVGAKSKQASFI